MLPLRWFGRWVIETLGWSILQAVGRREDKLSFCGCGGRGRFYPLGLVYATRVVGVGPIRVPNSGAQFGCPIRGLGFTFASLLAASLGPTCHEAYTRALQAEPASALVTLTGLAARFEDPAAGNQLREAWEGKGRDEDCVNARKLLGCVYRNLATISEEPRLKASGEGCCVDNLPFFLKALACNADDLELWVRLSQASRHRGLLKLSRWSLERCLGAGSRDFHSPLQWKALTQLVEVLYEIGDVSSCKRWLEVALSTYPNFTRGVFIQNHLPALANGPVNDAERLALSGGFNKRRLEPVILPASKRVSNVLEVTFEADNWASLGLALLKAYKVLERASPDQPELGLRRTIKVRALDPRRDPDAGVELKPDRKPQEKPAPPTSGAPAKRVTRASVSLTQDPRPRVSHAWPLTSLIPSLFELKGYTSSAAGPNPALALLAGSPETLEHLVAMLDVKLFSPLKTPVAPKEWLRRVSAPSAHPTPSATSTKDETLAVGPGTFVDAMNSQRTVAEAWLLEFLYKVLGELRSETCALPLALAGTTIDILEYLTPKVLPHSFRPPEPMRLELFISACEMLTHRVKPKEPHLTLSGIDGLDALRLWAAKLQDEGYHRGGGLAPETAVRFGWLRAAYFCSISDPGNELRCLRELSRWVTIPAPGLIPSAYGLHVSPRTLEGKVTQAELRHQMLRVSRQLPSAQAVSARDALACLSSLAGQLENPVLSEAFRAKLAQHIATLCDFPCLVDASALGEQERHDVRAAKLRSHLKLLEFGLGRIFTLIGCLTHVREPDHKLKPIFGWIGKISKAAGVLADLLGQDGVRHGLGGYLTEPDLRTAAHATQVTASLCLSLYLGSHFREHVALRAPLQSLIVSAVKLVVNTLLAIPRTASAKLKPPSDRALLVGLSKFLSEAHAQLGPHDACELDGGALPKLCLRVFGQVEGSAVAPEDVYQCYYCLYRVVVGGTLKDKAKHSNGTQPLDMDAVTGIFQLIWPSIESKVVRGKMATPEIKAVLDRINQYLENTPLIRSAAVSFNLATIEAYLQSGVPLTRTRELSSPPLPTADVVGGPAGVSWVYTKLFLSQARLHFYQIRARLKTQNIADAIDWDTIFAPIKRHLSICPRSVEGWYSLASAYAEASAGMMRRSASYMRTHRTAIAGLQKMGLLSFAEGARLMLTSKAAATGPAHDFWAEFGYLVYVAIARPMKLAAFKSKEPPVPGSMPAVPPTLTPSGGYRLALSLFHRARRSRNTWEMNVMMAKCLTKLGAAPAQVLPLLVMAVELSADDVIEPSYQLVNFLYKRLLGGALDEATAWACLRKVPRLQVDAETLPRALLQAVESLKAIDKKRWHHKLHYLHARVHHFMFQDGKRALEEMQNLIKLNHVSSCINVWKPESERPGKHFVYVAQYLLFILEIAGPSATFAFLATLLRRIAKVTDSIYRFAQVYGRAVDMYIQAVRGQLGVGACEFIRRPWTVAAFTAAAQPVEREVVAQLAHANPAQVPVEFEYEYQVALAFKATLELAKLFGGLVAPPKRLLHLLVDIYGKLLGMFQADVDGFDAPPSCQSPLTDAELFKVVERFHRDFLLACK
ncbi:Histone transcription regulator 3 [Massospora cicadina]|nr:Histone transcription regulator 3 [Massospora cicadina]